MSVSKPGWLSGQDYASKGRKSRKQELSRAKELGGRRTPGSGNRRATPWMPTSVTSGGDVQAAELLLELKRAEPGTKSIGISREWLQKVTAGANRGFKVPGMLLTFEHPVGMEEDWVLIPKSYARLLGVGGLHE